VAASVFGPPAFARTWRATDNALEAVASLYSDLLLPLDEIGQLDPRNAGAAAYLLANGQGKSRSHRDGSARAAARFRLLFLSAGEVGLGDLVTASGNKSRAGHEVRVIDVPADLESGPNGDPTMFERVPEGCAHGEFADRLKGAAAAHHGHALRAWLQSLTGNMRAATDALRARRDTLAAQLCGQTTAGQVRRVAQRFALAASAGELATVHGLTGWQQGEAERAARACYAAWLGSRGTDGAAEPAAMLAQVRLFLSQHGESRLSPWRDADESHKPRTINRVGFRKSKDDPGGLAYYLEAEVFRTEICAGFDPRQVARTLAQHGALRLGSKGEFTRKERLPDGRSARVYVVLPELWADDGDDADGSAL
jgi:putative DNA primase/helicase